MKTILACLTLLSLIFVTTLSHAGEYVGGAEWTLKVHELGEGGATWVIKTTEKGGPIAHTSGRCRQDTIDVTTSVIHGRQVKFVTSALICKFGEEEVSAVVSCNDRATNRDEASLGLHFKKDTSISISLTCERVN